MQCGKTGGTGVGSYALVTYIPEPLGSFLDALRRELVPNCLPRAHVTILPPRELPGSQDEAWNHIQAVVRDFPAFEVELTDLEVFDRTSVVYLALGKGLEELRRLHDLLNRDAVAFQEPYAFEPHVTLAQDIQPEQVPEIRERAARRWAEYGYRRVFPAEAITFVRNVSDNRWADLARGTLNAVSLRR